MAKDGRCVRIDRDLYEDLARMSTAEFRTITGYINVVLREHVDEKTEETK